jgi:tRNA pseudouridine55 synthase
VKPAGLLLLDKPEGPTSHDVVDRVRRASGIRRVGHTGTLDPFASGLLILCVGWATRLVEYLAGLPKVYRAVIRLGERTDTDDRTGRVIARNDTWRDLDEPRVRSALQNQVGAMEQLPPAYSAKKVGGRRAYSVARSGGTPEVRPERVTVSRLSLNELVPPDVTVEVECSGGTYVRAIARDVGELLGVGAHLAALRRLRIGRFSVDEAVEPDPAASGQTILDRLLPPEVAVSHLTCAELDERSADALRRGQAVRWHAAARPGPVAVLVKGRLVAVAEPREEGLWPKKVFQR